MKSIKKIIASLWFSSLAIALPALGQSDPSQHDLNPLGSSAGGGTSSELISRVIRFSLGAIGVVALLFFIVGGFILLTSRGNSDKIKSGKDTIVWAIIGLFVAFSSYILLKYVIEIIITPS